MNYTDIYRRIYAAIKTDAIPHEKAHSISIRITDAIVDLRHFINLNIPELYQEVANTITQYWNDDHHTKLGGYDLDDKSIIKEIE